MKPRHYFIPALVSVTLAASGLAFAAGAGGGSSGSSPGDATGGASGVYPSQDAGQNPSATGTMHKSTQHKKHTKKASKQMNDTTNTPGADASSDTKGQ